MGAANLPPGVTGREDEFGPQAERTETRSCGRPAELWVVGNEAMMALQLARRELSLTQPPPDVDRARRRLDLAVREVTAQAKVEVDCPFDGEVDVAWWSTTRTWRCPVCGAEHEEEHDDGD
jgi:hypothetical protein